MKSGNLNFLEPSGPLQALNGTDLPTFFTKVKVVLSFFKQEGMVKQLRAPAALFPRIESAVLTGWEARWTVRVV